MKLKILGKHQCHYASKQFHEATSTVNNLYAVTRMGKMAPEGYSFL
jgi:hypothetical protein